MADIIDQLEVNYHDYEVCDSSARADIATINDKFDDYVTKAELEDYATKEELDDYATVTALNTAITTTAATAQTNLEAAVADLQESFQDGVDKVANACIGKGSTPVSPYTPDTVADAIDAIPTGGSGDCYSMFPQEIFGRDEEGCSDGTIQIHNNEFLCAAYLTVTDTPTIKINLSMDMNSFYEGDLTVSLYVDDVFVTYLDPAVFQIPAYSSSSKVIGYNSSYTFNTPLSIGQHSISIKMGMSSSLKWVSCNYMMFDVYGSGFTSNIVYNKYFYNGEFNYVPNNFVIPTNPVLYTLDIHDDGCGQSVEDVDDAMNDHFSSQFDSGSSFYMKGIITSVGQAINDTFTYSNNKFIYNHFTSAENSEELHYFVLPVTGNFFEKYEYIRIRGKVTMTSSAHGDIYAGILKRVDQNTVTDHAYMQESLSNLSDNEEFILDLSTHNLNTNYIHFIVIGVTYVATHDDPFTVEFNEIREDPDPQ